MLQVCHKESEVSMREHKVNRDSIKDLKQRPSEQDLIDWRFNHNSKFIIQSFI